MGNFRTLYRYELKKIINRKLFWISLALCLLCGGSSVFSCLIGKHYVDGKVYDTYYHMYQVDRQYYKALSGRAIDQTLLDETMAGYRRIPRDADRYQLTEEYLTYARPYSEIFGWIGNNMRTNLYDTLDQEITEESLASARREMLEAVWSRDLLSEGEKAFWREKEGKLPNPVVYYDYFGYGQALEVLNTAGVLLPLILPIVLSGVFYEEHSRRTDQLTLSTRNGRRKLYWAKILAGITTAAGSALLLVLVTLGLCLGYYGTAGFQAPIQLFYPSYSYPLTMGQACLIAYGILPVSAALAGAFVMVLSEFLRSRVAAMSVSVGLVIAGQVLIIPAGYRALSQIWNCLPMNYSNVWNTFDWLLIPAPGGYMTSWQLVPVCYLLGAVLLALAGKWAYQRYQVSGR